MSATWGTVTIGRLVVRETYDISSKLNMNTGTATVELAGEESVPPLTRGEWAARREDMTNLVGTFVPVTFTNATEHDGFYRVVDSGAEVTDWIRAGAPAGSGQGSRFTWNVKLELVGAANAVDLESRLTAPGRANDFAQAGERWHAPSVAAFAYTTPDGLPSGSVSRTSSDGALTVYRGVPNTPSARWAAALADYRGGRARVEMDGYERTGTAWRVPGATWRLTNGLIRIDPAVSSTLTLQAYDGAGWGALKAWNLCRGGSASANAIAIDGVTVIRNDFEAVTLRAVDSRAPGRNLVDLTLRRGSRFAEVYLQTDASSTLAAVLGTAEAGTAGTGYVAATANDADGDRYIVGSARTHTALTTQGGIQKTAVTALDAYIGVVLGGGSAASGDTAADLQAQYIGAGSETVVGVRR